MALMGIWFSAAFRRRANYSTGLEGNARPNFRLLILPKWASTLARTRYSLTEHLPSVIIALQSSNQFY